TLLSLNTVVYQLQANLHGGRNTQTGIRCGSSVNHPLSMPLLKKVRANVATSHRASRRNIDSSLPAPRSARRVVSGSPRGAVEAEAVSAKSNRGDWKLSSATMWDCYIHD